jgi:hypothetical protein
VGFYWFYGNYIPGTFMIDKILAVIFLIPMSIYLSLISWYCVSTLWVGPLTDISGAVLIVVGLLSGFGSFSLFNEAMKELFGK